MKITDLIPEKCFVSNRASFDFNHLVDDTRKVAQGDLFVVRQGVSSKDYSTEALSKGAVASLNLNSKTLTTLKKSFQLQDLPLLTDLIKVYHGIDFTQWTNFGVTGTNGKSTIASLAHQIFEKAYGNNLILGTLGNGVGKNITPSSLTTPGVFDLYEWLAKASKENAKSLTMEVSSHALDQGRIDGILYDVVLLTNLTQDHLDYHITMDAYLAAKSLIVTKYLSQTGVAWVWSGDESLGKIKDPRIRYYGIESADTQIEIINQNASGTELKITIDDITYDISSPLIGAFNTDNLIGVVAVAHSLKIPVEIIRSALGNAVVAGRLEKIELPRGFGSAFVDYAHTPDALKRVLETARKICENQLIAVFGCGGDRDKGKRPQMGAIAESLADKIIVTSDNPRTEDPQSILDDIVAGLKHPERAMVIEDRSEAIQLAASELKKNDLLIVAGKGHEDYQIIGTQKFHFDDREILRQWGAAQ